MKKCDTENAAFVLLCCFSPFFLQRVYISSSKVYLITVWADKEIGRDLFLNDLFGIALQF